MEIKKIIPLMLIAILLAGCGNKESTVEEKPIENTEVAAEGETKEKEVEKTQEVVEEQSEETSESSIGKVEESEIGKIERIKEKRDIGEVFETGPMKLTIKDIQISRLNPSQSYKTMFGDKDEATTVVVAVEVENTSDDTISFHPDQGTLVTDTKEQKDADLFLSDSVGGDFIGQVVKSGNIIFILDSKAEDINSLKFVFNSPYNQKFENIGEDLTITFDL